MFAFLALLFVLLVIYFFTNEKEGFTESPPQHTINIPTIPKSIPPVSSVRPSSLPGKLPIAPYEQIAASSPLPYQDTTLIKANRQQLINQLELLKGFLSFEAQEISERSDPGIQLPLTTARSDFHVLQGEVDVLNRNPGLQPTITLSHLNEISSNLAYLQREVRLIGSAGTLQGPVYEFTEGFDIDGILFETRYDTGGNTDETDDKFKIYMYIPTNITFNGNLKIIDSSNNVKFTITSTTQGSDNITVNGRTYNIIHSVINPKNSYTKDSTYRIVSSNMNDVYGSFVYPGPGTTSTGTTGTGTGTSGTTSTTGTDVATLDDLKNFIGGIDVEIKRLSASGTTNPITTARVTALTGLKGDIQKIVDNKTTDPGMIIPISKSDIDKAFPLLGDPSSPLNQVINEYKLPSWLANLFPGDVSNNPEISGEIKNLMDKYLDTLVNGVSASFSINYTSPREAEVARSMNSTIDMTGFPSEDDLNNTNNPYFMPYGNSNSSNLSNSFNSSNLSNSSNSNSSNVSDPMAAMPQDAGRGASTFDWKNRAKEIEAQVKKRGLNPTDFGIMPLNTTVSNDFSWKGYTRMMCTRLQATMDPSLPETCGCPPMEWQGWRISK